MKNYEPHQSPYGDSFPFNARGSLQLGYVMDIDKESYAVLLAKRAERAIKVLKILVGVAIAVFAILGVYCILTLTVITDEKAIIIGTVVLICCLVTVAVSVMSVLLYAYFNLSKLKKLK